MKRLIILLILTVFIFAGILPCQAQDKVITMSTTTSTEASGLLDYLLPKFTEDTGITVRVMSKGTGAAIRDGMDGNCDVIFVHDKSREDKFVEEGYGTKRYYIMYNDFVIVGPEEDPAGVKGAEGVAQAFTLIAGSEKPFVSRGDDSGTHGREKQLWKATDLPLTEEAAPEQGDGWYYAIGQGMGQALLFAEEQNGYVLADRGTFLKYKFGRDEEYELDIVYEGDDMLKNPYGIIPVNPEMHPHVNYDLVREFAQWMISDRGQELIGSYRLLGKQLFTPDAQKE
ncbi:MAG: substrate-binding domain-containing protein [Desulfonatronovibrio sp.]